MGPMGCAREAPAATDTGGVEIEYLAHASFILRAPDGTSLLLDPYQSRIWLGYDFPAGVSPDAILVTHPHYDHDAGVFRGADWPWPEVQVIDDPGTTQVGQFTVRGVEGKHADPYGEEFGQTNTIFVMEIGGLRLAHLGDNGPLTPENIAEIGHVDVVMIPADGLYHILDQEATDAAIEALGARVVIPMHYRIPQLESSHDSPSDLGDLDPWLKTHGPAVRVGTNSIRLTTASLPDRRTVMVLEHSPDVPLPSPVSYTPNSGTPVHLAVAGYAKVLCSAVYVSGRRLAEARRNSGLFFLDDSQRDGISAVHLNRGTRAVYVTHGDSVTRAARYHGDQGCIIDQREGDRGPFFTPVPVSSNRTANRTTSWPSPALTLSLATAVLEPEGAGTPDPVQVRAAVDAAFTSGGLTAAFLVVHKGRIIAERYRDGVDRNTQLESWSMGKSLTATLIGILMQQGEFDLDDPVPLEEWRSPEDPRSAIRIRDLMQMSGGLRFTAPRDPDYSPSDGYPDHMLIYTGALDAFEYSISRPLQFPPGTVARYRNSDPLALGAVIRRTVEARGDDYHSFPQRALFDRIGIDRQVMETDPYGNFLLTGFDYGTARGWARLAMLYQNDGVWNGERLLPEGFVEFVRTPAPAWEEPVYGGLFWLNGDGAWNLPEDAYFMAGGGGQRVFIVPSQDLIVVRLGHFEGNEVGMAALNEALALLGDALPTTRLAEDP